MLELRHINLSRSGKTLLKDASLTLHTGDKVGLIGKNGSGKSTLFAMIRGELSADGGTIILPKNHRIAWVAQETPSVATAALDYVLAGDSRLQQAEQHLAEANRRNDGDAIAVALHELDEADAYSARARAGKLLSGLGFPEEKHLTAVKDFSGGWRMRLNLAQALFCPADLLLLDEPTNHLDLESVLWLENHLLERPTTQIIISHDRDFLNTVTSKTAALEQQTLTTYGGNYDFYAAERGRRLLQQQAAYAKQQAHIRHMQSFIERFRYKATKARQAQSRIKSLEKIERISAAHLDSELSFTFADAEHLPNPLIRIEKAQIGYTNHVVLDAVNFSLENNARFGLLGTNGSGKSTFIRSLTGDIALLSGQIIRAEPLKIGYFAQHQMDVLRPSDSPLAHLRRLFPDEREQELRDFLGSFAFHGDKALEPIATFSGGEKARLALALLVRQHPNLLLLDEPTNHLDLDMRHALALALQSFSGALIVVSHDRSLLESTCDAFLLIDQGHLRHFEGDLHDYRRYCNETMRQEANDKKSNDNATIISRKDQRRLEAQRRQDYARLTRDAQKSAAKAEKAIEKLQQDKSQLEAFLADENAYNAENKILLDKTLEQLANIEKQLPKLEETWLQALEEIEAITQQLNQES